jgi:hypothetical protein
MKMYYTVTLSYQGREVTLTLMAKSKGQAIAIACREYPMCQFERVEEAGLL